MRGYKKMTDEIYPWYSDFCSLGIIIKVSTALLRLPKLCSDRRCYFYSSIIRVSEDPAFWILQISFVLAYYETNHLNREQHNSGLHTNREVYIDFRHSILDSRLYVLFVASLKIRHFNNVWFANILKYFI